VKGLIYHYAHTPYLQIQLITDGFPLRSGIKHAFSIMDLHPSLIDNCSHSHSLNTLNYMPYPPDYKMDDLPSKWQILRKRNFIT